LLRSADLYSLIHRASEFGLQVADPGYDWAKMIQRSRSVADRMNKGVAFLMKKNGIEVHAGRGRLGEKPGTVLVGEQAIEAKRIMIATGGRPWELPGVSFDGERIITSREAMILPERPERLLIVGAGAIGVEFAYFYSAFGTKVTIVEMLEHLLPVEDDEIAKELERSFSKKGMTIRTSTKVTSLKREGRRVQATLSGPKGEETVDADLAKLRAAGEEPVEGLLLGRGGRRLRALQPRRAADRGADRNFRAGEEFLDAGTFGRQYRHPGEHDRGGRAGTWARFRRTVGRSRHRCGWRRQTCRAALPIRSMRD